jgi:hypothetical protein
MASDPTQKRLDFDSFQPFDAHTQDYWNKAGAIFRSLLWEGVQQSGDKQGAGVAQDLSVAPSQFCEAGRGVASRHFSALWVPRSMQCDPQDRALSFLARLRGKKLVAVSPMTPAQVAKAALRTMLEDGTAGRALIDKAFGPDADAVVAATLGEE